ncbi:MAG: M48 family metalloprotease [Gracilimonas sp.]|nr:M48 family metalloprotease [Gracilimonas sp.]
MKKLILSFFGVLFVSTAILSYSGIAQTKYTNQTADMREGPAAYHEFLLRLYINNRVELDSSQGYWDRIWFKQTRGWVPSYTLSDQQLDQDKLESDSLQSRMNLMFSQMDGEESSSEENLAASPAQVSAAVKGFAEKWRATQNINYNVDLDRYLIEAPSPTEFQNFIGVRERKLQRMQKRRLLYPDAIFVPYTDPAVDQIGYAVATAVAQKGLIANYQLQRYLDLLSGLIVENSHKPELDFSIFILDEDEVQGYSLPGNYVFISKGALKQMRSEAELVHFLAHEIAHLVFSHGMLEYQEREEKIKAESMFDELNRKLADENRYTEEEEAIRNKLNEMTDQLYDYINSERLEEYEVEADYWGIIYTYLSGYNPNEAVKYLNRIQISDTEARMEWNGLSLENRISAINRQVSQLNLGTGNTSSELFNRLMDSLD